FTTGAGDCNLSCYRVLSLASSTCAHPPCRVYSEYYSAYAGCASARPPGADTRRPPPPPPLAGVVPFSGQSSENSSDDLVTATPKSCGDNYPPLRCSRLCTESPSSTNVNTAMASRRSA